MIIRTIIDFFIGLLPSFELPENVTNSLGRAVEYAQIINYYVPVDTFASCVLTLLTIYVLAILASSALQLL